MDGGLYVWKAREKHETYIPKNEETYHPRAIFTDINWKLAMMKLTEIVLVL